jgi:hypothetical protein
MTLEILSTMLTARLKALEEPYKRPKIEDSSGTFGEEVSGGHKFYDTVDEVNNNEETKPKKKDSSESLDVVESLFK